MKSSTSYFHMKIKILVDFQICISVLLNNESFRTLMIKVEWTMETLNDTSSPKPTLPSNLLPLKSNVVMTPPVEFSQPDLFSKKAMMTCSTYCRIILEEVEKIISSEPTTYTKVVKVSTKFYHCANFTVADIVLFYHCANFTVAGIVLLGGGCRRGRWPMARIVSIETWEGSCTYCYTPVCWQKYVWSYPSYSPSDNETCGVGLKWKVRFPNRGTQTEYPRWESSLGNQVKRHVINSVNSNIPIITM